jgi:hypothetical protein
MLAVRMMEMAVHEVICVITVGHLRMPAIRSVDVVLVVTVAVVGRRALIGISGGHF